MGRLCDLGVSKNYFGRQLKFLLRFISLSGGYQGKGKLYTSTKSSSGSERVQDHLGQAYMGQIPQDGNFGQNVVLFSKK